MHNPHKPLQYSTIQHKNKPRVSDGAKANAFIEQYSGVSTCHPSSRPLEPMPRPTHKPPDVTRIEVDAAIAALATGKAPGSDGIHAEMLKRLGPNARTAIATLVSRTMQLARTPKAFRVALVVPLLKLGKDPTAPASYRPVALTSVLAKLAERVTLKRMSHFIELPDTQFGFRALRSTEDAVQLLVSEGHRALRGGCEMAAVLVDFSKAFDKVDHRRLLGKLRRQNKLPEYLINWIGAFLQGRIARTRVGARESRSRAMTCGVPQGTILGPVLFNLYTADLLESLPKEQEAGIEAVAHASTSVGSVAYADDLTLFKVAKRAEDARAALQHSLDIIDRWAVDNFMEVNASKTVYAVFSKRPRLPDIALTLNGTPLQRDDGARLLGVFLDPQLTMKNHASTSVREAHKRAASLKKIASRKFGPRTADLRSFLIGFVRSKLMYGMVCAHPSMCQTRLEDLERVQRGAARVATGLMPSASDSAALLEANLLPLDVTAKLREIDLLERAERGDSALLQRAVKNNPTLDDARARRPASDLPTTAPPRRPSVRPVADGQTPGRSAPRPSTPRRLGGCVDRRPRRQERCFDARSCAAGNAPDPPVRCGH